MLCDDQKDLADKCYSAFRDSGLSISDVAHRINASPWEAAKMIFGMFPPSHKFISELNVPDVDRNSLTARMVNFGRDASMYMYDPCIISLSNLIRMNRFLIGDGISNKYQGSSCVDFLGMDVNVKRKSEPSGDLIAIEMRCKVLKYPDYDAMDPIIGEIDNVFKIYPTPIKALIEEKFGLVSFSLVNSYVSVDVESTDVVKISLIGSPLAITSP